ncbi:hypothetical protein AAC387_Pa02g3811 [Persea americana]
MAGLPSGIRFQPTDQELLVCYLGRKILNLPLPCNVIKEIEWRNQDPWEICRLGEKGENKCYFFTSTLKNNWNWGRRNRVANNGHWKPTARDRHIYDNRKKKVGIKKTLVFINLRGKKTNWIMHEYMIEHHREENRNNSTKLDDWVLCCIYKNKRNRKKKTTSNSEVKKEEDYQNLPTNIRMGDQETTRDAGSNERNVDEDSVEGLTPDLAKLDLH